jgi:hypothetical protein
VKPVYFKNSFPTFEKILYYMKNVILFIALSVIVAGTNTLNAQLWTDYNWEEYATTFKIPSDFEVKESTASKFHATNKRITLVIYPRNDVYDNYEDMEIALLKWANDSQVNYNADEELIILDETKMNNYWGMLLEGTLDDYPVGMLIMADPDYSDITLFVWVSYLEDEIDTVLEMLQSIRPM